MRLKPCVPAERRPTQSCADRRRFLQYATIAALVNFFPTTIFAAVARILTPEKNLSFYNTHTRESLETCYFRRGDYCPEALVRINYILRDHRTSKVKPIDTRLLDLLHGLSVSLQSQSPFHVISGYRSPRTNASLRRKSKGVAAFSLHMQGKAIDIRLPRCPVKKLRRAAVNLQRGGVGYYPRLNFVHVDVGRVRYW
ncbi:MAG: DUF882 domain-containing protein [Desulfobacterales bacterium]